MKIQIPHSFTHKHFQELAALKVQRMGLLSKDLDIKVKTVPEDSGEKQRPPIGDILLTIKEELKQTDKEFNRYMNQRFNRMFIVGEEESDSDESGAAADEPSSHKR